MEATAPAKVVKLTYKTTDGKALKSQLGPYNQQTKPPVGYTVTTEPPDFSFEAGQHVTIKSDQRIRVIFEPPDRYQPSVFYTRTKDNKENEGSVLVLRAARDGEKGMLRCGPVNENGDLIGPESGHDIGG